MSVPPIPTSPPSSHGSGSLELDVLPSLRLLALLVAWGGAACFAILDGAYAGWALRLALLAACVAGLLAGGRAILPRSGVARLRLSATGWQLQVRARWHAAELERAVEVLRSGWWLQWRCPADGRCFWAWIDAARTPRAGYRALCRALQQPASRAARDAVAARTHGADRPPQPRRRSRRAG